MNDCKWVNENFDCCEFCDKCYCHNCQKDVIKPEPIIFLDYNNKTRILNDCWVIQMKEINS